MKKFSVKLFSHGVFSSQVAVFVHVDKLALIFYLCFEYISVEREIAWTI